jgi:hypothetical protein
MKQFVYMLIIILTILVFTGCPFPTGPAGGEEITRNNAKDAETFWRWYEKVPGGYTLYARTGSGPSSILPYPSIQLPFFSDTSPAAHDLYKENPEDVDMWPGDGWVLFKRDFGTPNRAPSIPYFILYNRLIGIMRFFFFFPNSVNPFSYAHVVLSHQTGATSHFCIDNPRNSATDNYNPGTSILAVSQLANTSWSYADFNLSSFDPDIVTKDSFFWIRVIGVQESAVKLDGSITLEQVFKEKKPSAPFSSTNDFIGVGVAAVESYKTTENAINSIKKWATDNSGRSDIIGDVASGLSDAVSAADGFGLLKAIPYVGAVAGAIDFISGLFGKPSKPVPMCFRGSITLSGTITLENPQLSMGFAVPGSVHNNPEKYENDTDTTTTLYNNPLGLFILDEHPVVYCKKNIIRELQSTSTPIGTMYSFVDKNKRHLQCGLKNSLSFSINEEGFKHIDGVDYEVESIKAAFVWEQADINAQRNEIDMEQIDEDYFMTLEDFNETYDESFTKDPYVKIYKGSDYTRIPDDEQVLVFCGVYNDDDLSSINSISRLNSEFGTNNYDVIKLNAWKSTLPYKYIPRIAVKITIMPENVTSEEEALTIFKTYDPEFVISNQTDHIALNIGYNKLVITSSGGHGEWTPLNQISYNNLFNNGYTGYTYTDYKYIVITNNESVPVTINKIYLSGSNAFTINASYSDTTLQPGQTITIRLTYTVGGPAKLTTDLIIDCEMKANNREILNYTISSNYPSNY